MDIISTKPSFEHSLERVSAEDNAITVHLVTSVWPLHNLPKHPLCHQEHYDRLNYKQGKANY
jgi:hypothetical protein